MKPNVRCWTPPAAAPLIVMLWLTGCAMAGSKGQAVCPPVVEYSAAQQARATAQRYALPENAVVVGMLGDYAVLRDQARACR